MSVLCAIAQKNDKLVEENLLVMQQNIYNLL